MNHTISHIPNPDELKKACLSELPRTTWVFFKISATITKQYKLEAQLLRPSANLLNRSLLLLFLSQIHPLLASDPENIRFSHLNLEDGLSQNAVLSIAQDPQGFLWFGTQDGLNRYDGHHFQVYRYLPNQQGGLISSYIQKLLVDSQGTLWIGTIAGMSFTEQGKAHFQTLELISPKEDPSPYINMITALFEDSKQAIWIGTASGDVFNRNAKTKQLTRYSLNKQSQVLIVKDIMEDKNHRLWVATAGAGLMVHYPNSMEQWRDYKVDPQAENGLKTNSIFTLYLDKQKRFWLAGEEGTLSQMVTTDPPSFKHYTPEGDTNFVFFDINEDQSGRLWLSSNKGIYTFDPDRLIWQNYTHKDNDPYTPSSNVISCSFKDKEGLIWFGSEQTGINKWVPSVGGFEHVRNISGDKESINNNHVTCFTEDAKGGLWVGTYQGVNYRAPGTKVFEKFTRDRDDPRSLSNNDVTFIYMDRDDTPWVGTFNGGLNKLQPDGSFVRYQHDPKNKNSLSTNVLADMIQDDQDVYWIATFGGGLNRMEKADPPHFTHYKNDPKNPNGLSFDRISDLELDKDQTLWIATLGSGLDALDSHRSSFKHYKNDPNDPTSISQDTLLALHIDSNGTLWIGTDTTGLNKKVGEHFVRYDTRDGLPNNVIYGILEDDQGILWLSTNKGLSRFNPIKESFFNYNVHDGLQSDEFNQHAFFKARDGKLYFGGINGYTAFYPKNLQRSNRPPNVVFTDLLINNQSVVPSQELDAILKEPITTARRIRLDGNTTGFTVEFATLSYSNPKRNYYAYKLENLDKDWIYTDATHRRATYTHLSAGSYILKVKGCNHDGIWSSPGTDLKVDIISPPWKSYPAYIFYGLIIFSMVTIYHLRSQQKRRELELAVEKRTSELHQKNMDLESRYDELNSLERIVISINKKLAFDDVINTLLEQGLHLFPKAQASAYLKLSEDRKHFEFIASAGLPMQSLVNFKVAPNELYERFGSGADQLEEGIYLFNNFKNHQDASLVDVPHPESLISMIIVLEGTLEGILLLGNMQEKEAFRSSDIKRLKRFQEHVSIAVGKARIIYQLTEARQELARIAHTSGMAELAANVLHELGNTLNSIRTSAELLADTASKRDLTKKIRNLNSLVSDNQNDLAAFFQSPQGQLVPEFLQKLYTLQIKRNKDLSSTAQRIIEQVEKAVEGLKEQQKHSQHGDPREMVDLNRLMEQAIQNQSHQLRGLGVQVIKEQRPIPSLLLETNKLTRVIGYLLNNSAEAISAQGPKGGIITCSTGFEKNAVFLKIQDNGIGLPEEDVTKLFQYGFTTKKGHKGFGLHYCANALKELGGELVIHPTRESQGTTVILQFPK